MLRMVVNKFHCREISAHWHEIITFAEKEVVFVTLLNSRLSV